MTACGTDKSEECAAWLRLARQGAQPSGDRLAGELHLAVGHGAEHGEVQRERRLPGRVASPTVVRSDRRRQPANCSCRTLLRSPSCQIWTSTTLGIRNVSTRFQKYSVVIPLPGGRDRKSSNQSMPNEREQTLCWLAASSILGR